MKIKIKANKSLVGGYFYTVLAPPHGKVVFETGEGALAYAHKFITRWQKESAAFSMVRQIGINLLNVADSCFIQKLQRNKCKGISKSQYGYLKGIYERQQREW